MRGSSDQTKQLAAWCALWRAPGVGAATFQTILQAFASPLDFFMANHAQIKEKLPKLSAEKRDLWVNSFESGTFRPDLDWLSEQSSRHILLIADKKYPRLLKEIADPPALLFVQGNEALLNHAQIAIVGSRNASPLACRLTQQITSQLVREKLIITSGLALGIDGIAHQAALDSGGLTIAVVATGLDKVYPARHHDLAHQIAERGAIVSEFPIGTGVRQSNFPRRNRVISGMSLGVFVSEASLQSGSLITARHAGEQGREVFAMPGSVNNPLAKGCHHLIRQGAKLVESGDDILEELLPLAQASLALAHQADKIEKKSEFSIESAIELDADYLELLNLMGFDPCRIDELIERGELTSEQISAMLLILELDGQVVRLPGGRFQRTITQ